MAISIVKQLASNGIPDQEVRRKKKSKRVRFGKVRVNSYERPEFFAAEVFFSEEEYRSIKDANSAMVRMMTSGQPTPENTSYRGLEQRSRSGYHRCPHSAVARQAVLDEVERQRFFVNRDDELIAKIYQGCSAASLDKALKVAQQDAIDAERDWDIDDVLRRSAIECSNFERFSAPKDDSVRGSRSGPLNRKFKRWWSRVPRNFSSIAV